MRIAGALLICLSCLIYCLRFSGQSRRRLRELDSAASMLELMAAELDTRLTPLPELARSLSSALPEPARGFLLTLLAGMESLGEKSFSSIWSECAARCFPLLERDELAALSELGGCLGRYELERQLASIELCAEAMRRSASRSRAELPDNSRLHLGLACSGAALLVVVLF